MFNKQILTKIDFLKWLNWILFIISNINQTNLHNKFGNLILIWITDKIKTKYQFLGQNLLKTSIRKIFLTLKYHLLERKKKEKVKIKVLK